MSHHPRIEHYPTCTADYPEKPEGEPPQPIIVIDLGNGELVWRWKVAGDFGGQIDKGLIGRTGRG